jgi:formylglycine-generating enzyme required for sulfatase activity
MRLCTEAEWMRGCQAGNTPNPNLWSYTTTPGTYVSGRCNDDNASGSATWPTGSQAACAARWSGNRDIFDLSGNVSEWTSTTVTQNSKTYFRVRGGNYLSLQAATTCEFNFVLQRDTFRNFDLGFRCCSDAAPE